MIVAPLPSAQPADSAEIAKSLEATAGMETRMETSATPLENGMMIFELSKKALLLITKRKIKVITRREQLVASLKNGRAGPVPARLAGRRVRVPFCKLVAWSHALIGVHIGEQCVGGRRRISVMHFILSAQWNAHS